MPLPWAARWRAHLLRQGRHLRLQLSYLRFLPPAALAELRYLQQHCAWWFRAGRSKQSCLQPPPACSCGARLTAPAPAAREPPARTLLRLQQRAALALPRLKEVGIQVGGAGGHRDERRPGGRCGCRRCRCVHGVHGGGGCSRRGGGRKVSFHVQPKHHLVGPGPRQNTSAPAPADGSVAAAALPPVQGACRPSGRDAIAFHGPVPGSGSAPGSREGRVAASGSLQAAREAAAAAHRLDWRGKISIQIVALRLHRAAVRRPGDQKTPCSLQSSQQSQSEACDAYEIDGLRADGGEDASDMLPPRWPPLRLSNARSNRA